MLQRSMHFAPPSGGGVEDLPRCALWASLSERIHQRYAFSFAPKGQREGRRSAYCTFRCWRNVTPEGGYVIYWQSQLTTQRGCAIYARFQTEKPKGAQRKAIYEETPDVPQRGMRLSDIYAQRTASPSGPRG